MGKLPGTLKLTAVCKAPENRVYPKRKLLGFVFQPSIFSSYVSFREGIPSRELTSHIGPAREGHNSKEWEGYQVC